MRINSYTSGHCVDSVMTVKEVHFPISSFIDNLKLEIQLLILCEDVTSRNDRYNIDNLLEGLKHLEIYRVCVMTTAEKVEHQMNTSVINLAYLLHPLLAVLRFRFNLIVLSLIVKQLSRIN